MKGEMRLRDARWIPVDDAQLTLHAPTRRELGKKDSRVCKVPSTLNATEVAVISGSVRSRELSSTRLF